MDLDVTAVITEVRIYADEKGGYPIPLEYRSNVTYGANVKALAAALYSEGVMSNDRITSFLNAAANEELELSNGSIYRFCKDFAEKAEGSIEHLETEILNHPIVSTDVTVVTKNGKQQYIWNFSIKTTVIYRAMKDRIYGAPSLLTQLFLLIIRRSAHNQQDVLIHESMIHTFVGYG